MQFTPEVLGPMVEIGKEDAKTIVGAGVGTHFQRFKEWNSNKKIRLEHPDL